MTVTTVDVNSLTYLAAAAISLPSKVVPREWIELLLQGWTVVPSKSDCGGTWIWLDPQGKRQNCVCHHTPEPLLVAT